MSTVFTSSLRSSMLNCSKALMYFSFTIVDFEGQWHYYDTEATSLSIAEQMAADFCNRNNIEADYISLNSMERIKD